MSLKKAAFSRFFQLDWIKIINNLSVLKALIYFAIIGIEVKNHN